MNENSIQQLEKINYSLLGVNSSIKDVIEKSDQTYIQLSHINSSLQKIGTDFNTYQSSFTNQPWFQFVIGAAITLFATWFFEYLKIKKAQKEYMYYLQRCIVDQLNLTIDTTDTVEKFLKGNLSVLLNNIDSNPGPAYSIDSVFLPLFSIRSLPDDLNNKSSGSGYIDNKVAKIYAMSKDMPHMMDDLRLQLRETLNQNEKIALGKLNSATVQKDQYKRNILQYKRMVEEQVLGISFPLYIKKLSECLVAVREKSNIHSIFWKFKFDPRWKLYKNKTSYLKARQDIVETMDKYFQPTVEVFISEMEKSV